MQRVEVFFKKNLNLFFELKNLLSLQSLFKGYYKNKNNQSFKNNIVL